MCIVPDMRPPQHPEQPSAGVPATVTGRYCRTKPIMIARPQQKKISEPGARTPVGLNRAVRRTRCRRPASDLLREPQYFPHTCNNCGHTFIPRGLVASEFCGGECRHSFQFFLHVEKRKLAQQELRRQQQQQQQQQQQHRQHEQRQQREKMQQQQHQQHQQQQHQQR